MSYFQLLSCGGLLIPSPTLANILGKNFAALDAADSVFQQHTKVPAKYAAEYVLSEYINEINVGCNDHHVERCKKFAIKIMVNGFYHNRQKIYLTESEKNRQQHLKNNNNI